MTELQTRVAQFLLSRNYSVETVAEDIAEVLCDDENKNAEWWHAKLIELIDKGDLTA